MQEYNTEEQEVELSRTEKKIQKTKANIATMKQIEKLQKEVSRIEKNLETKKAKIEELAELL